MARQDFNAVMGGFFKLRQTPGEKRIRALMVNPFGYVFLVASMVFPILPTYLAVGALQRHGLTSGSIFMTVFAFFFWTPFLAFWMMVNLNAPYFDFKNRIFFPRRLPGAGRHPESLLRMGGLRFDDIVAIEVSSEPDSPAFAKVEFLLKDGARKLFIQGRTARMRANAEVVGRALEITVKERGGKVIVSAPTDRQKAREIDSYEWSFIRKDLGEMGFKCIEEQPEQIIIVRKFGEMIVCLVLLTFMLAGGAGFGAYLNICCIRKTFDAEMIPAAWAGSIGLWAFAIAAIVFFRQYIPILLRGNPRFDLSRKRFYPTRLRKDYFIPFDDIQALQLVTNEGLKLALRLPRNVQLNLLLKNGERRSVTWLSPETTPGYKVDIFRNLAEKLGFPLLDCRDYLNSEMVKKARDEEYRRRERLFKLFAGGFILLFLIFVGIFLFFTLKIIFR